MAFVKGERFHVDLDSDPEDDPQTTSTGQAPPTTQTPTSFISDILERTPTHAAPPSAPTLKNGASGFPAHKKRAQASLFKQQRLARTGTGSVASPQPASSRSAVPSRSNGPASDGLGFEQAERRQIDEENKQRIASMSPAHIEKERQELFEGLSPALIQRLLRRANIDDGRNDRDFDYIPPTDDNTKPTPSTKPEKKVTFDTSQQDIKPVIPVAAPADPAPTPEQSTETNMPDASPSIHFPKPPQPTDEELDPSAPDFLENLHKKYFPNLPYDPSTLSWMAPIDESNSSYSPSLASFTPSSLRFSFRGTLISPTSARKIPVTMGLHHHGDAPEAAGYTIPELAILARSKVPAQRCIAFQALGRILYRLGKGEFGLEEGGSMDIQGPEGLLQGDGDGGMIIEYAEGAGSELAKGLWECIESGHVIETLSEEANKQTGHLTARTYAQEALWNWRRGGGRKRKAV